MEHRLIQFDVTGWATQRLEQPGPWVEALALLDLRYWSAAEFCSNKPRPSVRTLGKTWGWSYSKVGRFIARQGEWAKAPTDRRPKPLPKAGPRDGFVYFVGADDGPIKIGFSVDPEARLAALQTGSAFRLRILLLLEATSAMERDIHESMDPWRVHGEWFERDAVAATFGLMGA